MASIRENVREGRETTWSVLYRHGKRQSSRTFGTEKAAGDFKALLDIFKDPDRAMKALLGEESDNRLTVDELAERFLAWKARPGEVEPRTLADYRRNIANWIAPHFGHRAAESIDETDVQRWVDHMAKTLAPKSVADRHMLLHQMYDFGRARSRRLVGHNPCLETELPRVHKKRAKGTTVAQWQAILDAAAEVNPDAGDLIRFLGSVGWRFSEGIALPVAAVEHRYDRVWVNMTQVFRMIDNRQILVVDAGKSFAAFRRVEVLNEATAAMLLRRCVGKAPTDYVFTNSRGNHWNQNTFLRSTWPRILERAGLWQGPRKSPTPHWLRHMAVSVLLANGIPADEVRRYVGHDDVKVTLGTYGGLAGGVSDEARQRVNQMLDGVGPQGTTVLGEVVAGELEG